MILPNVTVTPAAAKFIRRMVRFSEHPAGGFRLSVTPGGCSGYSSEFSVQAAPLAGDAELVVGDVRVFLPPGARWRDGGLCREPHPVGPDLLQPGGGALCLFHLGRRAGQAGAGHGVAGLAEAALMPS